ncbi:MAG: TipAS antibiotic-recognition domain-containing protein [Acidimicrobiales bacterium]
MAKGLSPESMAAMDLAEEHRLGLRRWFFDCTPELHVAFADHFQDDERMRGSFEGVAPGLTEYLGGDPRQRRSGGGTSVGVEGRPSRAAR